MPKISDLPADTAPATDDLIVMVDVDASRTEAVTVANLAASAAFSGAYVPRRYYIPASGMMNRGGATATNTGNNGRVAVWSLPDTSFSDVTVSFYIHHAGTYAARVWYVNPAATGGNVVVNAQLRPSQAEFVDGGTMTTTGDPVAGGYETVAAPSQYQFEAHQFTHTWSLVVGPVNILLGRNGGDAADTLASAVHVAALELVVI